MLIAFAGQKRSGKDTAARALIERGFTKLAFADAVRSSVEALDPIIGHWPGFGVVRVSDAFAEGWDWESIKTSPYADEARRLLQHMGTEVGRNILGPDTWVNAADNHIALRRSENWVITDCRFANEARWVKNNNGLVVHLKRTETDDPNPVHASEVIDFTCDVVVTNDGSVEDLERLVLAIAESAQ